MICAFEASIEYWPALFTICDIHRSEIKPDILSIVNNIGNKRLVEEIVQILKPISIALDKVQASTYNFSDAVIVWLDLFDELKSSS